MGNQVKVGNQEWEPIPVDITAGDEVGITPLSSLLTGQKNVTTAGNSEQLSAISIPVNSLTIKALPNNSGIMYVGDASVSSAVGFPLEAGETLSLDINDVNLVYVDSTADGDGVAYVGVVS